MSAPRFVISPPTTTGDDGIPSSSCAKDMDRVLRMIDDERHISAMTLLKTVRERLDFAENTAPSVGSPRKLRLRKSHSAQVMQEKAKDIQNARQLLTRNKALIQDIEERCRLFRKAKQNLNVNDDWTLAQTFFGVTTYYRRETDGSLSIKLEGELDGVPLFDQVAVLREVDLHCRWAPFCSSSLTVAHLAKLDTVGWFVVGLPQFGLMRDACFRVMGSDSIHEDGSILLVGQGIADKPQDGTKELSLQKTANGNETVSTSEQTQADQHEFDYLVKDPILKELELPEAPTKMGSGRMTIRTFQAIIHVESPTSARTKIIANVDPNLPLIPQSLLDFLMKKLCGVLLSKLQNAAKKVSKDPIYNPHACKMREEEAFYKQWLMAKFQSVCNIRGWEMPPVSAFELTDQQLEMANAAEAKRNRNKSIKLYHSLSGDKLDDLIENGNNNSGHSEPANIGMNNVGSPIRALSDSDSVSALSHNSGVTFFTLWKNNPVAVYMRELEEKTELRKAREVEKSRERAANRLKPRSLDPAANSRLKELQAARKRRELGQKAGQKPEFPPNATSSERDLITVQHKNDWATFWTGHNTTTRVMVMVTMMFTLFSLLYMDPLFQSYMSSRHRSWWGGRTRDVATLLYLGISAFMHFSLCYVALMYAFSSLQIGSIAGREAKRYYSDNIHLIVGIASGGIVGLGVLKATLAAISRWITWKTILAFAYTKHFFTVSLFGGGVPESLKAAVDAMYSVSDTAIVTVGSICDLIFQVLSTVESAVVKSNVVGRSVEGLLLRAFKPFSFVASAFNGFVDDSICHYEGERDGVSWREDLYVTTRAMLSYSAFFLLVLLGLFNLQAQSARTPASIGTSTSTISSSKSGDDKIKYGSGSGELSDLTTSTSSGRKPSLRITPPSVRARSVSKSKSPAFDTIEEGSDEGGAATNGVRSLNTPRKKKKGMKFFKKSGKSATASM